MNLDIIRLEGLVVRCVIGVYPSERDAPQPLAIDVELHLDTREAASHGLKHTLDYARVCGELRFLLESCRFLLLETAADALARYLLAPPLASGSSSRARLQAVKLRLTKPSALAPVRASLEITRRAEEFAFARENKAFGEVDVIVDTPGCGVYRLRVAAGQSIPTHVHRVMEEHEMVLSDGLYLQGKRVLAGTVLHWPHDHPHRYDNPSDDEQTILCVDRPSFLPGDEILVTEPAAGLPPANGTLYYPAAASEPVA